MPAETALQEMERLEAAGGAVFPNETPANSAGTVVSAVAPRRAEIRDGRDVGHILTRYFQAMSKQLGPMHWWSAGSEFEVIVGAILVQNTAWTNAKMALANLRRERLLTVRGVLRVPMARLAKLIRSSGYYRQKAKKLKAFVQFLEREYGGSLKRMSAAPTEKLREQLLAVHGIGPETADSILLYAAKRPVFVVDAYTKRLLARHSVLREDAKYGEVQELFTRHLPRDTQLFNEYHALIVNVAKRWCRAREARCDECPLVDFLQKKPAEYVPRQALEVRA